MEIAILLLPKPKIRILPLLHAEEDGAVRLALELLRGALLIVVHPADRVEAAVSDKRILVD